MEGWASSWIEQVYTDPKDIGRRRSSSGDEEWSLISATGCAEATAEAWEPDATKPEWPSSRAAARVATQVKVEDMRVRAEPVAIYRYGRPVYTPPQGGAKLHQHLKALWQWIQENGPTMPLIATAAAHYQFEAIHPFVDSNGRAGRVLINAMLRRYRLPNAERCEGLVPRRTTAVCAPRTLRSGAASRPTC